MIVPGPPVSCTLSEDGKLAFASAEETDTVYIISVADRKIVGEIKTGGSGARSCFFAAAALSDYNDLTASSTCFASARNRRR